jgi:hypothetical protein
VSTDKDAVCRDNITRSEAQDISNHDIPSRNHDRSARSKTARSTFLCRHIATNQCCWTSRPCWVNQSAATQWRPVPCRGKPKPSAGAEATRASHDASLQKCLVHGSIRYELMTRMPYPLSTGSNNLEATISQSLSISTTPIHATAGSLYLCDGQALPFGILHPVGFWAPLFCSFISSIS